MQKVISNLLKNWKTSVTGLGLIAFAGGATISGQPVDGAMISNIIAGLGLIVASDQ